MKSKILLYAYPLIGIIIIGALMLKPNFFNLIPFTIYNAFKVSSISESEFIVWFDVIFLIILYLFLFRITKRIINWKRNHLIK